MQVNCGRVSLHICVLDVAALVEESISVSRLVSVELVRGHSVWQEGILGLKYSII